MNKYIKPEIDVQSIKNEAIIATSPYAKIDKDGKTDIAYDKNRVFIEEEEDDADEW